MTRRPDSSVSARPGAPGLESSLASYRVPDGHWDELLDGRRAPRAHWARFAARAGVSDLARQEMRAARQIRDNGVTYHVYEATGGPSRPWALDVLPVIVPPAEWDDLARGLRQRARLLNAIAADLYGPQRLVADGLVPPELVFGHSGFLRACHGFRGPDGVYLHHVAFDLGRGRDGRWRVVGTRAQAPSGVGYALENRLIVSRLFPDAFRELHVERLARFFERLQAALLEAAPAGSEAPHIALLTPGPYAETYFEHAFLARYLGFTLAEGGDLTVRGDRVYLKTLRGLRPVHAILRRLDDDYCDPLELRPDSALGVPGLLQAWRAGTVLVANPFGMSVLESPGLLGFLAPMCEHVLGEPLALPSVPTWWCGEPPAFAEASARLDQMIIKGAAPDLRMEPVFAADLDAARRSRWAARLSATPARYVLQEYLPLSHAPIWQDGRIESRALMLRVFLVTDGRGDYHVMPGGLSRIAGSERQVVSGQRGGSSKDTWALSEAPVETFSLLPGRIEPSDVMRAQGGVSSRAGENLFWLGRYAERSENGARLLRAVLSRLTDGDLFPAGPPPAVIRACRRQGLLRGSLEQYLAAPHRLERALIADMYDRDAGFSLAFDVEQTRRVAGAVRERLSTDTWRLVNHLAEAFRAPARDGGLGAALDLVDQVIASLAAAGGIETERMTRDDGWRLLGIGRYIERLLSVTTTVAEVAASGGTPETALLEWLLDFCDSAATYRARYVRPPEWLPVADLLLCDPRNPRSAAFQLAKLDRHVSLLPEAGLPELVDRIARVREQCRIAEAPERGLLSRPGVLEDFLSRAEAVALALSDALTLAYFSHVYEPAHATAVR
jgi:uncharacterized circularly permuted ATP-grasp superfamily protein/uncharacterized alpha-E superfamily protein